MLGQPSGGHERVDDIIDVDIVTDSGAVAVDGDRVAGEQRTTENRDHPRVTVRILARTETLPSASEIGDIPYISAYAHKYSSAASLAAAFGDPGSTGVSSVAGKDIGVP